jgi:hypothetical protein
MMQGDFMKMPFPDNHASVAPQELNRIAGVDKTCNFVKVGYKILFLFIINSISLKKKKKSAMGCY